MILPIGTMAPGQTSPYSAASAMALDPIYIAVDAVPDFVHAGGVTRCRRMSGPIWRTPAPHRRCGTAIVRRIKDQALDLAFGQFLRQEWEQHTPRAAALAAYIARERWWLDDYALFQALSDAHGGGVVARMAGALARSRSAGD